MLLRDESNVPDGWEALPLPDGRILAFDPEDDEEYLKVAEAYPHLLAGDVEEFRRITNASKPRKKAMPNS